MANVHENVEPDACLDPAQSGVPRVTLCAAVEEVELDVEAVVEVALEVVDDDVELVADVVAPVLEDVTPVVEVPDALEVAKDEVTVEVGVVSDVVLTADPPPPGAFRPEAKK